MCMYHWDTGRSKGKKRCHEECSEKYHFTDAIVQQLLWNLSFSNLKEDHHSCKISMDNFLLTNIEQPCSSTMPCVGDALC